MSTSAQEDDGERAARGDGRRQKSSRFTQGGELALENVQFDGQLSLDYMARESGELEGRDGRSHPILRPSPQ